MEGGAKLSAGGGPFIFRLSIALSDAASAEARDKPKLFRQAAPRCPLRVGLSTNGTTLSRVLETRSSEVFFAVRQKNSRRRSGRLS